MELDKAQTVATNPAHRRSKSSAAASVPTPPRETRQSHNRPPVPDATSHSESAVSSSTTGATTVAANDKSVKQFVTPVFNPYLSQLEQTDFPTTEVAATLQQDDLDDSLLMLCCSALASVKNRALCPKEIAEVMMYRGWVCNGTQPFAVVSSAIRAHLKRRGFNICTHSNGKPAKTGLAPPLFTSYELTGPVAPIDAFAMGIEPEAKPAVKRGTLWYLAEDGTGFTSPFGERDPNRFARTPVPPAPKPHTKAASKLNSNRRTSLPATMDAYYTARDTAYDPYDRADDSAEDEYVGGLGRGKRKRKISGIAGGDASWHSTVMPISRSYPGQSLPTVAELSDRFADAPATSSALASSSRLAKVGRASSPVTANPQPQKDEFKIKLSVPPRVPPGPVLSKSLDVDTDTDDVQYSDAEMAAIERRRFKKRSKSDGSLLLFAPHFNPYIHSTLSTNSPVDTSAPATLGYFPTSNLASHSWTDFRSNPLSAATSAVSADLEGERLEEAVRDMELDLHEPASAPVKDTTSLSKPMNKTVSEEEDDDFHEAMLDSDFLFTETEFTRRVQKRRLARLKAAQLQNLSPFVTNIPSFTSLHSLRQQDVITDASGSVQSADRSPIVDEDMVDTPATTPRSWTGSVKEDPELYENAARNHKSGIGAQEIVLEESNNDSAAANAILGQGASTLSTSPIVDSLNGLLSPAPELPILPLVSAASTVGFAPAVGETATLDELAISERNDSRAPSTFSHRSFSPVSSFANSPIVLHSPIHSRASTPSVASDADSFDVNLVIKQEVGAESLESPLSTFDDEDTFGRFDDFEDTQVPDIDVDLNELDIGWTESSDHIEPILPILPHFEHQQSSLSPTPFGPEVFGFVQAPIMEWKPACSLSGSPIAEITSPLDDLNDLLSPEMSFTPFSETAAILEESQQEHANVPKPPTKDLEAAAASKPVRTRAQEAAASKAATKTGVLNVRAKNPQTSPASTKSEKTRQSHKEDNASKTKVAAKAPRRTSGRLKK